MVDALSYFSFQLVLHNWYNKGCGMCCPVCGIVHIKEPLLPIGKSSPSSGGSGFSLSLSGPLPYLLRTSFIEIFPSFFFFLCAIMLLVSNVLVPYVYILVRTILL